MEIVSVLMSLLGKEIMTTLTIDRFSCCPEIPTLGKMMIDGQTVYTLELPWLGNQPSVSCIPGNTTYNFFLERYNKGGYDSIEIEVLDRTYILFHRGNKPSDIKGCILVGLVIGVLNGEWAVLDSKGAWDIFWPYVKDRIQQSNDLSNNLTLRINNPGPPPSVDIQAESILRNVRAAQSSLDIAREYLL